MARRLLIASSWVVVLLAGCAPTTKAALDRKDYAEAVCAATHGSNDDRRVALATIARDLEVALYVHAVTREELEAVFGDETDAFVARAVFLRVRAFHHDSNLVRGTGLIEVVLDASGARRYETTLAGLASLTGERPAQTREVTVDTRPFEQRVREGLCPFGELGADAWNRLTFGLVPIRPGPPVYGPGRRDTIVEAPSRAELERTAPRAVALADADLQAWSRPAEDDVALRVHVAYTVPGNDGPCIVADDITVPLPRAATLEERINTRFGPRYVRLDTLTPKR